MADVRIILKLQLLQTGVTISEPLSTEGKANPLGGPDVARERSTDNPRYLKYLI